MTNRLNVEIHAGGGGTPCQDEYHANIRMLNECQPNMQVIGQPTLVPQPVHRPDMPLPCGEKIEAQNAEHLYDWARNNIARFDKHQKWDLTMIPWGHVLDRRDLDSGLCSTPKGSYDHQMLQMINDNYNLLKRENAHPFHFDGVCLSDLRSDRNIKEKIANDHASVLGDAQPPQPAGQRYIAQDQGSVPQGQRFMPQDQGSVPQGQRFMPQDQSYVPQDQRSQTYGQPSQNSDASVGTWQASAAGGQDIRYAPPVPRVDVQIGPPDSGTDLEVDPPAPRVDVRVSPSATQSDSQMIVVSPRELTASPYATNDSAPTTNYRQQADEQNDSPANYSVAQPSYQYEYQQRALNGEQQAVNARHLYEWFANKGYGHLSLERIDENFRMTQAQDSPQETYDHKMFGVLKQEFETVKSHAWFHDDLTADDLLRDWERKERNFREQTNM